MYHHETERADTSYQLQNPPITWPVEYETDEYTRLFIAKKHTYLYDWRCVRAMQCDVPCWVVSRCVVSIHAVQYSLYSTSFDFSMHQIFDLSDTANNSWYWLTFIFSLKRSNALKWITLLTDMHLNRKNEEDEKEKQYRKSFFAAASNGVWTWKGINTTTVNHEHYNVKNVDCFKPSHSVVTLYLFVSCAVAIATLPYCFFFCPTRKVSQIFR